MIFALLVMSALFVACDKSNEGDIKVVITSESEIKVGKYATDVTIRYDILGIEDVKADVKFSQEGWLRVKSEEVGAVVISVAENETDSSRMAAITLSYGTSQASVIVSQSGDALSPVLTSLSGEEITLERMGKRVEIAYALENANPTDYIYVKTNADWIYSIDTTRDGVVTLGVGTNTTKAMRETEVTVGYGTASFKILLTQRGDGDINFKASIMGGEYLGDAYTPGAGNYWFWLSDRGFDNEGKAYPSATYYRIDAYGEVYSGGANMVPIANGTYTYDPENTYDVGTFTAEYSGHWVTNTNGKREGAITAFDSGTLVVENGKITLDVIINGEAHHVEYIGDTTLPDSQGEVVIYSTLDGDYDADLSDHYLVYDYYGDYYEFGYTNWMFVIKPNDGEGDCIQFDIITDKKSNDEGFCGNYISSDYLATNSFIPGWTEGVNMQCSWFFTTNSYGEVEDIAPLRGGEMSVKDNGDGTLTVEFAVKDDLRHKITGSWTGVPKAFVE